MTALATSLVLDDGPTMGWGGEDQIAAWMVCEYSARVETRLFRCCRNCPGYVGPREPGSRKDRSHALQHYCDRLVATMSCSKCG